MKTAAYLFALAFLALAIISCSEANYYEEQQPKHVDELIVPSDFDWNMITKVQCNFSASAPTPIKVYTDKICNDNALVAEYILQPAMDALSLPIPTCVSKLYVKVDDGAAIGVLVENGSASFQIPSTRAETLPGDYDAATNCIYFPSKEGFATVMFEDFFPTKGDYDFNDLVAKYKYTVELSGKAIENSSKLHVASITFYVQVVALGGSYTFVPYIKVHGMKVNNSNGFEGNGASILTGSNDNPVIHIHGYTPKQGGKYLNTDPTDPVVPYSRLNTVSFKINAKNNSGTGVKQGDIMFDFYLKGVGFMGNPYEIHQRGFDTVELPYPWGFSGLGSIPYTADDNLIWGFTVPADIKHATENTNFLYAYPAFAAWAQSGGINQTNWYTNGANESYLFTIPEN